MSFYQQLQQQTEAERAWLLRAHVITDCLAGKVTHARYLAFLTQAYHHVKHTVPLLMAAGSRLADDKEWLRDATCRYIGEEIGHQEWVLNDIAVCGGDAAAVRAGQPAMATDLMVAYAYDCAQRRNPVSFFGMVQVLEGTSIALAQQAAGIIRRELNLPVAAFSYLLSHGELDQERIQFFAGLMDRLHAAGDRHAVVHAARVFYRLYGDLFRSLTAAPEDGLWN
jgi:pyrroloquinoline quinone (PQQ) biosynthesis protein C